MSQLGQQQNLGQNQKNVIKISFLAEKKKRGGGGGGAEASKLVFYAQSTITVISGQDTFCHHTKDVKNVKLVYI